MFDIYPEASKNIQYEIMDYKEFAILKKDDDENKESEYTSSYKQSYLPMLMNKEHNIILENYQLFINNFLNPITPYNRLLINFSTGSGKSLTALTTAKQYIDINPNSNVIILGFTKDIFKYELASKKIFNTLSKKDREMFLENRNSIWKLNSAIKKDYIMYGYQGLFNLLFTYEEGSINDLKKSVLIEYLKSGKIKVNKNVLDKFKDSFLICDEVHNLYNMLEPNNWAIAIMFILDYYPEIKVLFLSATPLKHSSKEIIYLINLLNKREDRIRYGDLFRNKDFSPDAEDIIREKTYGKVCYVNIFNPIDYPSKNMVGSNLILNKPSNLNKNAENINKYFNFVKCKVTPNIAVLYKNIQDENTRLGKNANMLNIDKKYLIDYAIPSTSDLNKILKTTEEIHKEYIKPSKSKHLYYTSDNVLTGDALKLDNLNNISPKYSVMLNTILDILSSSKSNAHPNINGKILIFHPYVKNSGVMFIEEILKQNGIIKYGDPSFNNTRCTLCGKPRIEHSDVKENDDLLMNSKSHAFKPIQFININGNLNKSMVHVLLNEYNKPENNYGENIKILLASSILQEGYTLKCVQHLFLTHIPLNISSLQQILGRAVRKSSHSLIPEKKVNIYILVHSLNSTKIHIKNGEVSSVTDGSNALQTFEEYHYQHKIKEYIKIQYINSILYNNAIDLLINKDINTYDEEPPNVKVDDNSKGKIVKLNNYQHVFLNQTILIIKYIIKRLFIEVSSIFEYTDLYNAVLSPPFKVNIDSNKILEKHFNLAINELVYNLSANISFNIKKDNDVSDLLIDDSIIFYNYQKEEVIIRQHNNFFFLTLFKNKYQSINHNELFQSNISFNDESKNTKININAILNGDNVVVKTLINNVLSDLKDDDKKKYIIYNYSYDNQLKMLEYIIESKNKYSKIIEYYDLYKYIIFNPKDKSDPIGHCFNKNYKKIYNKGNWNSEFDNVKLSFKFDKYYLFHDVINGYVTLKLFIIENAVDKNIKDKRLLYKGMTCKSIPREVLNDILVYFKIDDSFSASRKDKCMFLEDLFLKKKNNVYFLNMYENANLK